MNGRSSRAIRRLTNVDAKVDGKRKYYHFNEQKAAKKLKADNTDPIIAESKRQIYRVAKKMLSFFKNSGNKKVTLGNRLEWIRNMISESAKESLANKGV